MLRMETMPGKCACLTGMEMTGYRLDFLSMEQQRVIALVILSASLLSETDWPSEQNSMTQGEKTLGKLRYMIGMEIIGYLMEIALMEKQIMIGWDMH